MRGRRERTLGTGGETINPLGATLRAWRHDRHLSLQTVAERAGFGQGGRSYISKIEHGKIPAPGIDNLSLIARALGIDTSVLLANRRPESAGPDPIAGEGQSMTKSPLAETTRPGTLAGGFVFAAPPLPPRRQALGELIEREISAAALSTAEEAAIADRLVTITRELVALVKTTRPLQSGRKDDD